MSLQFIRRQIDALVVIAPSCELLDRNQLLELKACCSPLRNPKEFTARFLDVIDGSEQDEYEYDMPSEPISEEEFLGQVFGEMFGQGDTISDYEDIISAFDDRFIKKRLMAIVNEMYGPIEEEEEETCPDCQQADGGICSDCFSESNQALAPDQEEQVNRLDEMAVKLCSECLIPETNDICADCILENIRFLY